MELKLGANIQAMRRERGMTQEQLATAMGVTVGAVSKWEKGSCCPDVQLILELAEFFGTSVDVLLGYGWEQGGMGRCAEHIRELLELKRYDEGCREAAKALTRYPNSFPIVYRSGKLYLHAGFERHDAALVRQALAALAIVFQLRRWMSSRFARRAMRQYRELAFDEITRRGIASLGGGNMAAYISALTSDAAQVEEGYVLSLFAIVQQTVGVIGALAMMLWYSPLLTVAAVLLALLPAVASMACGGRLARAEEAVSRANAAFVDTVRDMRFGG